MELNELTVEQLQTELDSIAAERDKLGAKAKYIASFMDRAMAKAAVKNKVASMSKAEKEALAQELGIASV